MVGVEVLDIEDELDERPLPLRERLSSYVRHSRLGLIMDIFQILMSLFAVGLYIAGTYMPTDQPNWMNNIELLFAIVFLLDYLFRWYISANRIRYVVEPFPMIDLITAIPIFIEKILVAEDASIKLGFFRFVRVIRVLRILRSFKVVFVKRKSVAREIFILGFTITTIIVCAAGIFQVVESTAISPQDGQDLAFHDAVYYMIVTVCTVGYGDISPKTPAGRMIMAFIILLTVVVVPVQTTRVINIINMRSKYDLRYETSSKYSHVVVCGSFADTKLYQFFNEFFHEDHNNADCNVVILCEEPTPSEELRREMDLPEYDGRIVWLHGSALSDIDLDRCGAESAKAIFLLTDDQVQDATEADKETLLRAMSLQQYRAGKLVIGQILLPRNVEHLQKTSVTHVFCIQRLKLQMLAMGCRCPGSITLMSHLMSSSNEERDEGWGQEYSQGMSNELYMTKISMAFKGVPFSVAAAYIFTSCSATLLAVEIPDSQGHIALNPSVYVFKGGEKIFLICSSQAVASKVRKVTDLTIDDGPDALQITPIVSGDDIQYDVKFKSKPVKAMPQPTVMARVRRNSVTKSVTSPLRNALNKLSDTLSELSPTPSRADPPSKGVELLKVPEEPHTKSHSKSRSRSHSRSFSNTDDDAYSAGSNRSWAVDTHKEERSDEVSQSSSLSSRSNGTVGRTEPSASSTAPPAAAAAATSAPVPAAASGALTIVPPTTPATGPIPTASVTPATPTAATLGATLELPKPMLTNIPVSPVLARQKSTVTRPMMLSRQKSVPALRSKENLNQSETLVRPGHRRTHSNVSDNEVAKSKRKISGETERSSQRVEKSDARSDAKPPRPRSSSREMQEATTRELLVRLTALEKMLGEKVDSSATATATTLEKLAARVTAIESNLAKSTAKKNLWGAIREAAAKGTLPKRSAPPDHLEDIIMMCGFVKDIAMLIAPLRASYLATVRPIVIVHSEEPPEELWKGLTSKFEDLYFVLGDPLAPSVLSRAGLDRATCVLILNMSMDVGQAVDLLADANALLLTLDVLRRRPDVFTVTELIHSSNAKMLPPRQAERTANMMWLPCFAAGRVFTSSLLESAICQAYYNEGLTKILELLVTGSPPVGSPPPPSNLPQSYLFQVDVDSQYIGRSYSSLFHYLTLEKHVLPLALYRSKEPLDAPSPFVMVSPDAEAHETICMPGDRVFVLAHSDSQAGIEQRKGLTAGVEMAAHAFAGKKSLFVVPRSRSRTATAEELNEGLNRSGAGVL